MTRILVALVLVGGMSGSVQGDAIYWTDRDADRVASSQLDGSNVTNVIGSGFTQLADVCVAGGKLYAADSAGNKIVRADLDGSNVETIISTFNPYSIAVDPIGGSIYFEAGGYYIQRANLDGSGVSNLVAHPGGIVQDIALDISAGKIYWINNSSTIEDTIMRANLVDGSDIDAVLSLGTTVSFHLGGRQLAIDSMHSMVYWTEYNSIGGDRKVRRANLDGTGIEDIYAISSGNPTGIDVDPIAGKVYWTDQSLDTILRANLDGSDIETVVSGLDAPNSLSLYVVPEPTAIGHSCLLLLGLLCTRRHRRK